MKFKKIGSLYINVEKIRLIECIKEYKIDTTSYKIIFDNNMYTYLNEKDFLELEPELAIKTDDGWLY